MPLARIITRHPDSTSSLFQQLQWLGYSVEIRTPEEVCACAADLEVEFEVYSQDAAPHRAAELAASLNAGVTVAPGALQFVRQPVVEEAVLEMRSEEEIPAMPAAAPPALPELHPADASRPEMTWAAEPEPPAQEMPEVVYRYEQEESGPGAFARLADGVQTAGQRFLRVGRVAVFGVARGVSRAGHTLKAAAVSVSAGVNQSADKYRERRRIHAVELPAAEPKTPKRSYFRPQLRSALTGAACASALFIVGMALAGFHPRTPLPEGVVRTSSPGATVETGGVTLQSTGTETGVAARQAVTQPPATANHPVQTHSSAASPSRHRARRRGVSAADDDVTVDDVIVRHYPHNKAASRPQQASLKHYSDLDH
ncbi:MAG TPA: hypothetical protein VFK06_09895 [Candidatus Angelobacter sp.]|nr:hypothetical protein [Candidatus Angelobacter sp.]